MRSAARTLGLLVLVVALPAVSSERVAAQVIPDSARTDSAAAAPTALGDTLAQETDSTRLAIMRRLERLARPVGADSILFAQDSARLAEAAAGQRPGVGIDSVATSLMGLRGYVLTEYEGDAARFGARDRVLLLRAPAEGRARVSQEGMTIEADSSITFNERTGPMRTCGEATFTPPDGGCPWPA